MDRPQVTLAIAVVAHPARLEQARALAAELDAELILDDEGYGDAVNHARAWEWLAGQGSDWSLAIEDDAAPVSGLRERLARHIAALPEPGVLLLYTGSDRRTHIVRRTREAHAQAQAQGRSWIRLRHAHWGVGIAAPTEHAAAIATALRETKAPSDDALGYWARTVAHLPIYATHPNLVDHADGASVIPNHGNKGERKALWLE